MPDPAGKHAQRHQAARGVVSARWLGVLQRILKIVDDSTFRVVDQNVAAMALRFVQIAQNLADLVRWASASAGNIS
jgi:hypothetical protein